MTRVHVVAIASMAIIGSMAVGWILAQGEDSQFGTPKEKEGTRIFQATEHPDYSGAFHISGPRTTMVGSLHDASPWDHLDYADKHLLPVQGSIAIQVNELTNTGLVTAEFAEGKDHYKIIFDRFMRKLVLYTH